MFLDKTELLHRFASDEAKNLFIAFCHLLAMYEGSRQTAFPFKADSLFNVPYRENFSGAEMAMVRKYGCRLGWNNVHSAQVFGEIDLNGYLQQRSQEWIDRRKDEADIRKQTIEKILADNIDLLSVNEKVTLNVMKMLPEIKQQVFMQVVEDIQELHIRPQKAVTAQDGSEKTQDGSEKMEIPVFLSEEEKRIMLFYWLYLCYGNGQVLEGEMALIRAMCAAIELPEKNIAPIHEKVQQLVQAELACVEIIEETEESAKKPEDAPKPESAAQAENAANTAEK